MKTLTVLFGMALLLAVVGPSQAEHAEHEHQQKQLRHRPKRQFLSDYGYPWPRPQYEHRRDDRYQQDQIPNIYRILEELSDLVRRPPPPPQPIYIPYPVHYPVPQYCHCQKPNRTVDVHTRFPEMDDDNQNWGYDESQVGQEDYSQNARPINLDPIRPSGPTSRPPPSVDHGTNQVGSDSTKSPRVPSPASKRPKRCDAVVLSCCNPQDNRQKQFACFTSSGCASSFENNDVCSSDHVQEILELFVSSYSPVN